MCRFAYATYLCGHGQIPVIVGEPCEPIPEDCDRKWFIPKKPYKIPVWTVRDCPNATKDDDAKPDLVEYVCVPCKQDVYRKYAWAMEEEKMKENMEEQRRRTAHLRGMWRRQDEEIARELAEKRKRLEEQEQQSKKPAEGVSEHSDGGTSEMDCS